MSTETISISNLPTGTPANDSIVCYVDRADGVTKRADWSEFPAASGDMLTSTYDPAGIAQQVVGTTANQTLTNKTLTTPKFADLGYIADSNGNEMLAFNSNASAVNYIELENNVTGSAVHIRAKGDDANVGLHLVAKGATGYVNITDSVDETKRVRIDPSSNTTGVITTLKSSSTTSQTITLPNATDTLVGKATTDTLTNKTLTLPTFTNGTISFNSPEGFLINGKIVPSVASNNLTLAIKTVAGTDASSSNPIYVRIGDSIRTITGALSRTVNAGTNWFNAGSAELATKEVDYFAYLTWDSTDSTVNVGFARIPYGTLWSDFIDTTTSEKFVAWNNNPNTTDTVVNIGRFAATLSAGAGYTWSIPTFTSANLIQRPIFESKWLDWTPVATGYTAGGARYKIDFDTVFIIIDSTANITGNSTTPFKSANTVDNQMNTDAGTAVIAKNTSTITVATNPQNINGFYGI